MTFTVLGPPSTKGSTRSFMSKAGKLVTVADAKSLPAWTQAVGWAARAAGVTLVKKPHGVGVYVVFEFVRPSSAKRRAYPSVKPDADKMLRALLDALTGVAYEDDAQVVSARVSKRYGSETRAVIRVDAWR